jgi:vancomycin resistance protein VanJ
LDSETDTTRPRRKGWAWVTVLAWVYVAGLLAWFVIRLARGDDLWWSALLSSFTPFFFVPLLVLLPLALFAPSFSLRLAAFIPAAIFVLLYGRLFLPTHLLAQPHNPKLKVMTFNMWGGSRSAETARVIAAAGYPDIVALQELTPRMTEIVLNEVGSEYPYFTTLDIPNQRGLGILSKASVEPLNPADLVGLERCDVQVVRVTSPERSVIIYNIHLYSTNLMRYLDFGVPVAEASRSSIARRAACIEAVLADIGTRQEPVIVLGDFNATDQNEVYHRLRESLHDTHRDAGWGFGHTFPTFDDGFRGIPILARVIRIDMIFYDHHFRALSSRVSAVHGESNHHPVIAELAWR